MINNEVDKFINENGGWKKDNLEMFRKLENDFETKEKICFEYLKSMMST